MLWAANTSLALNFQTAREYKPKDAGMNDASWLFPPLFAAPGRCPWIPAFFFRHRHLHGKSGPNAPSRAPTKRSPPCERPPRLRRSSLPHPLLPRPSPCRPRQQDRFQKIGGGLVLPVEKKRFGCGNVQKYTGLTKTKRKIRQEFSWRRYNCLNY